MQIANRPKVNSMIYKPSVFVDVVVLFIPCLIVVVVIVVRGNLNKCEVNFQGAIATKDVNLRQWP